MHVLNWSPRTWPILECIGNLVSNICSDNMAFIRLSDSRPLRSKCRRTSFWAGADGKGELDASDRLHNITGEA
ncbi:unnamed protein product [Prunus armeniaca]